MNENNENELPLIVVHIQEIGLREQVEPVIKWLIETGKCAVILVLPLEQINQYKTNNGLKVYEDSKVYFFTESEFLNSNFEPEIIFSLHPETPSILAQRFNSPNIIRIVMQHGLTDKSAFYDPTSNIEDPLKDYDGFFLSGEIFLKGTMVTYAQRNPESYNRIQFFAIGSPKTDSLFTPVKSREELFAEYGYNPLLPLVTYAPTYEKEASLEQSGMEILNKLSNLNANVLIKLHHISLKLASEIPWVAEHNGGKDWRKIVTDFSVSHPNVKLAKGSEGNLFLSHTDLLITDVSGIGYEYLLLNKPILFIDVPDMFVKHGSNGVHYSGREAGEIIYAIDQLNERVVFNLKNPDYKKADREKVMNQVAYNIGHATEAAGKTILELAEKLIESKVCDS